MDSSSIPTTRAAVPLPSSSRQDGNKAASRKDLRKTSQEFEALYYQHMLQAMRRSVPEGGLMPKSNATRLYEELLDSERARIMSRQQSLGVAATVERQAEKKAPLR